MTYKHRTQSGKVKHYQSRGHYERSLKGMFGSEKKNHSKKINKLSQNRRKSHRNNQKRISHKTNLGEKEERLRVLKNRLEQLKNTEQGSKYPVLYDKILKYGGDVVIPIEEEDLGILLEKGAIQPYNIELNKDIDCEEGECHTNAAIINLKKGYPIGSGYALLKDEDGLNVWRQHSWNIKKTNGGYTIIESTWNQKGLKYWGTIEEGSKTLDRLTDFFNEEDN